jgi:hypothetical protein
VRSPWIGEKRQRKERQEKEEVKRNVVVGVLEKYGYAVGKINTVERGEEGKEEVRVVGAKPIKRGRLGKGIEGGKEERVRRRNKRIEEELRRLKRGKKAEKTGRDKTRGRRNRSRGTMFLLKYIEQMVEEYTGRAVKLSYREEREKNRSGEMLKTIITGVRRRGGMLAGIRRMGRMRKLLK